MDAGGAVNINSGIRPVERFKGEVHTSLKELRRLGKKIIIGGVVQHGDRVALGQWAIVKFNLHVDDVGDAVTHQCGHVFVVPDSSADRDAVSDPGQVHISMLAFSAEHSALSENNLTAKDAKDAKGDKFSYFSFAAFASVAVNSWFPAINQANCYLLIAGFRAEC